MEDTLYYLCKDFHNKDHTGDVFNKCMVHILLKCFLSWCLSMFARSNNTFGQWIGRCIIYHTNAVSFLRYARGILQMQIVQTCVQVHALPRYTLPLSQCHVCMYECMYDIKVYSPWPLWPCSLWGSRVTVLLLVWLTWRGALGSSLKSITNKRKDKVKDIHGNSTHVF